MKLVEVFHQRDPDYLMTAQGKAMPADSMVKVASFETELDDKSALEEAFTLTNAWNENHRLKLMRTDVRNTSVGDVVVIDGRPYQCGRGWNRLDHFEPSSS